MLEDSPWAHVICSKFHNIIEQRREGTSLLQTSRTEKEENCHKFIQFANSVS